MRQFLASLGGYLLLSAALSAAPCTPSSTVLCLNDSRFEVEVSWRDSRGRTGVGQAKTITADTGYFWFFSETNIELVIKVLDARSINEKYWVFFGALSSVEFDLTVTDTVTGAVKTYHNPLGQFASVGDTGAFDPGVTAPSREIVTSEGAPAPPASIEVHPEVHRCGVCLGSRGRRLHAVLRAAVRLQPQRLPISRLCGLEGLTRPGRNRPARPAHQRHGLLLVLLAGQRRADGQGPRCAVGQRQLLGVLRRAIERGVHAARTRHIEREPRRLTEIPCRNFASVGDTAAFRGGRSVHPVRTATASRGRPAPVVRRHGGIAFGDRGRRSRVFPARRCLRRLARRGRDRDDDAGPARSGSSPSPADSCWRRYPSRTEFRALEGGDA